MTRNVDGSMYEVTRMVPPINLDYNFKVVKDGEKPFPMRYSGKIAT